MQPGTKRKASAAISLILAAFCLGVSVALAGPDDVAIPDEALQQALINCGADADKNGGLAEGELRALTGALNLSGKNIADITGLQYLTGLTSLDLSNNEISDISALASLVQLSALDVSNNFLDIADGSPARTLIDGLASPTCTVTYEPQKKPLPADKLSSTVYEIKDGLMLGVTKNTPPSVFFKNMNGDPASMALVTTEGAPFTGSYVTTGLTVTLALGGKVCDSLTIAVNGDPSADGMVSVWDYTLARLHILNLKALEGVYRTAGDVDRDGEITVNDYTLMRLDILNLKSLDGSDPSPQPPVVSDPRISNFLGIAFAQLGKPYVWGDEGPDTFDCSGFVHYSLNNAGHSVGRMSANSYSKHPSWTHVGKSALLPGDLLFYRSDDNPGVIGHVGIYLGDNMQIHASSSYGCVVVCPVDNYYASKLSHGRRVFN